MKAHCNEIMSLKYRRKNKYISITKIAIPHPVVNTETILIKYPFKRKLSILYFL